MSPVLSSRRHVEALGEDASAEDYIEAVLNCNNTIGELSDDWDASTRRELLLCAIGSQQV